MAEGKGTALLERSAVAGGTINLRGDGSVSGLPHGVITVRDDDSVYVNDTTALGQAIASRRFDEETELLLARILFRWVTRHRMYGTTNREFYDFYTRLVPES